MYYTYSLAQYISDISRPQSTSISLFDLLASHEGQNMVSVAVIVKYIFYSGQIVDMSLLAHCVAHNLVIV